MRTSFLLLFLLFATIAAYPQNKDKNQVICYNTTLELPSKTVHKEEDNQCVMRSFPHEDYIVILRRLKSDWNSITINQLKSYFFPEGFLTEKKIPSPECNDMIRWEAQSKIGKTEAYTILFLCNRKSEITYVWISVLNSKKETIKFFQDVFFHIPAKKSN